LLFCDALQGTQYNQLLTGMSERLASAAVDSQRQLPIFVGNGVCNPRAIEGRARAGRVADEIGDLGAQAGLPARRGGSGPSQEARRSIGDSTSSNDAARFRIFNPAAAAIAASRPPTPPPSRSCGDSKGGQAYRRRLAPRPNGRP
jgi:hypothetical protein